jgi:hypothetical protein
MEAGELIDVRPAAWPLARRRQLDADRELGEGDGGDGDVVVVTDQVIEVCCRSLCVHEEGRVEEQQAHGRVSASSRSRTTSRSRAQPASGRCRRRSVFASTLRPRVTGSMWATALPRRVMV